MLGSQCMSPHFEMHKFPYFDTFLSINGIQSCKHSNDEVCYFPMNLIQYYYFSQYVFHDLVCLVGMFLFEDVPMSGELLIQHVVKKESREEIIISIIQLLVIPFFFLTCLVYVLAILKLLGWLH